MTRAPALRTTPSILTAQEPLAFLRRLHGDGADDEALARHEAVGRDEMLPARQVALEAGAGGDREPDREPRRVALKDALAQARSEQTADGPVVSPEVGEAFAPHQYRRTSMTA